MEPIRKSGHDSPRRERLQANVPSTGCAAHDLLRRAGLLLANDTGVSHMAAALKIPSAIVHRLRSRAWGDPSDRERHRVLAGIMVTIDGYSRGRMPKEGARW